MRKGQWENETKKKSLAAVLTFTMLFSSLFSIIPVKAEVTDGTNLALNKTVTVSAEYGGNLAKEYLTDGDEETRWSTRSRRNSMGLCRFRSRVRNEQIPNDLGK
ncbi:hypothetical protein SD457_20045 [Coprobacillaceae bacterium CR2/5/TPMF4]|nr:hypothetical protein SD457_20045 [Coprobacillaceae bacterium CR2/5/TPMF4]